MSTYFVVWLEATNGGSRAGFLFMSLVLPVSSLIILRLLAQRGEFRMISPLCRRVSLTLIPCFANNLPLRGKQ